MKRVNMDKIIGIDLGTTNSVVAIFEKNGSKVIINEQGYKITPSVVAFSERGIVIGQVAKNLSVADPKNVIFSIKRLIGRKYDDEQVQSIVSSLPFQVSGDNQGKIIIETEYGTFSPQEISAEILKSLKKSAENYLGQKINDAVITIPAYFDENQREATKEAGELAGLNVKRIINEPTAASLAYGLDRSVQENIVVYDFGGGTFDVSVLEVSGSFYEVKSTSGDPFLGGDDLDERITKWILEDFRKQHGIDLSLLPEALRRIKIESEEAKKSLSTAYDYTINLPFINCDASGKIPYTVESGQVNQKVLHINKSLSREMLEELAEDLIERTMEPCRTAIEDAGLDVEDIGAVILVGGQSRMPKVKEKVQEFFGLEPKRNVNPDEVVAMGASIQGSVINSDIKEVTIVDITPLSLGIRTEGDRFDKVIEKNTKIPWNTSKPYTTTEDNQEIVEIKIYQGESEYVINNTKLGDFILEGIRIAPAGEPVIDVEFSLDEDGILTVSARDKYTGVEKEITISNRVV